MVNYKIAGFFTEFWPPKAGVGEGSVRESVQSGPEPDEDLVARYLLKGHALFDVMGVTHDLLGGGRVVVGGSSIVTDGAWIWRYDLYMYLQEYHVCLPTEFLTSVRANSYEIPEVSERELGQLAEALLEVIPFQ